MAQTLKDRIILITGASRGIGQAVAVRYAKEGAHVILTARDTKGLEQTDDAIQAAGGTATLVPADIGKQENVEMMAAQIAQRFGRLDGLLGNAAILGELTPMAHLDPDVWDNVLQVNLTANFHLIRCFDAVLKQSSSPRAVFVSSDVAHHVFPYWSAYAVSKTALEAMVKMYAAENDKTALRVNLIDPGEVRTRMNAKAFPGLDPETRTPPEAITDPFVEMMRSEYQINGACVYAQS
ncbi:MAG: SDR family NAD(P)-dependent oxidoreductase [Alphaproteobacteria bacterium]